MKTLDRNKLSEQLRFITRWKQSNARGSLEACPGMGKTTVGVLAIKEMNENHPERVSHVVVPTIVLKKQWENTIKEWKLQHVTVYVVNTYIREVRYCNLLILDEIHRYGSKTFREVFLKSRFNFILGLTATLERQDGMHELINHYAPVLRRIGLDEALEKGYVSDFKIYNLGISLSEDQRQQYEEIQYRFDGHFEFFYNDFDRVRKCLSNAHIRNQYSLQKGVPPVEVLKQAVLFTRFMQMRKTFLNEVPEKIDAVRQLYEDIGKKMIVFCETTAFADKIVNALGEESFAYHNAVPDRKEMKNRLEDFKNSKGKHKVVVAVKAIEEGLDVPDIEMAVIVSGNSTKRQYIQRMGRSLRVEPGKTALIINIYANGTKDENWLKNRQSSHGDTAQWVTSITEICQGIDGRTEAAPTNKHQYASYNGAEADF